MGGGRLREDGRRIRRDSVGHGRWGGLTAVQAGCGRRSDG
jgi:hypothetical protein